MIDLLIRGGSVVTGQSVRRLDVGVQGEQVAFVATPGSVTNEAKRVVEATGRFVVPGGVDPHVHFNFPLADGINAQSSDVGSKAAAYGGTTTFIDFAVQNGASSLIDAIQVKLSELDEARPSVDYALHAMITGKSTLEVLDEIPEAVSGGVTSFKLFTTFSSDDGPGSLYSDDGRIWGVMRKSAQSGAIVMVHCEDDALIGHNIHCLYRDGRQDASHVAEARTPLAEEAAIRRMLLLSRRSGCPLYVCHITSSDGLMALDEAKGNHTPAVGEVLHHNLSYTAKQYSLPEGMLYHTYPGLKAEEDRQALWVGVASGLLDSVASDDFTFPKDVKLAGKTVDAAAAGHNGIETRMPVFFSTAVSERNLDVTRFVQLTAEGPARLFGLFPRKGLIAPGSDADIVLMDPSRDYTIRQSELHSECDYSVWDGWHCIGYPAMTISKGQVLVENGVWVGPEGRGAFVAAGAPSLG